MQTRNEFTALVIDDDPGLRSILKFNLERMGYRVHTSENGQEGLELLGRHAIDLLVTDISMPKMNGSELVLAVHRRFPHLPIVVASGLIAELVGQLPENAIFLQKPFTFSQFNEAIMASLLRRDRAAA